MSTWRAGWLLNGLTKRTGTALEAEMTESLDYERHGSIGDGNDPTRSKAVLTEVRPERNCLAVGPGPVALCPKIVRKRQRRLTGADEIMLSLTASGLTSGEVAAHFAEVSGALRQQGHVSRIVETV